jgi:glycosyltransferase involved in cell wall biosynthesis
MKSFENKMLSWHPGTNFNTDSKFSILIPTWNNLKYLQICVNSIENNSLLKHQIIIHINEGSDGTLEWIRSRGYDYTYSRENIGICWALNACRSLVRTDYIAFLNDDMYMLPQWDMELWNEIKSLNHNFFFLSSTTIEPRVSPHPGILGSNDYGSTPETFREDDLLKEYKSIKGKDWNGATWPPNIVHKDIWDLVGGYSVEFHPGLYSDPDFAMKLFEAGVRYFKGLDASRTYHFGSKTVLRISFNNGSKQFLSKWGITSATFARYFLKRGQYFEGDFDSGIHRKGLRKALLIGNLKRFFWLFGGTGKAKGNPFKIFDQNQGK